MTPQSVYQESCKMQIENELHNIFSEVKGWTKLNSPTLIIKKSKAAIFSTQQQLSKLGSPIISFNEVELDLKYSEIRHPYWCDYLNNDGRCHGSRVLSCELCVHWREVVWARNLESSWTCPYVSTNMNIGSLHLIYYHRNTIFIYIYVLKSIINITISYMHLHWKSMKLLTSSHNNWVCK